MRKFLFALLVLIAGGQAVFAQADRVVIYTGTGFTGFNKVLDGDWSGGGIFDRRIRSIRVPPGRRVRIYSERNFRGTESLLTEDWNPNSPGVWWLGKIRSARLEASPQPPTRPEPPRPNSFPVIYAQANYNGPAMAVERDWAGSKDWDGRPHRIRSLRVPSGWFLVLYEKTNFRGKSYNLNADWTPQPGDWWNGRIRSIRVYRGTPPRQPR